MARSTVSHGSILVVDDEPTIAEVVARYLERAGYETLTAEDGPTAVATALGKRPDLIVLDIMLPGFDGLEVMRRTYEGLDERVPVILLTAKGQESDRVVGLQLGADDYVVKPFSPAELVARVDAVLRRSGGGEEDVHEQLRFGQLEIDPAARAVLAGGHQVELTQREFDLLLFLARHPGQVFSRDQLMDRVWQFSFYSDTTTVTVHIRRLRSKIEPDPSKPEWIQTVWGVGYRFRPESR
jgi:DNA-binding response OmpR family regulator